MATTAEDTILSQYVPGFRANLNLAPQQTVSRLLDAVDSDIAYGEPGQFFNADDVGLTDPEPISARAPDTPDKFIQTTRRIGMFAGWNDAQWIDNIDKARELVDPTSKIMAALMAGRWRHVDQQILTGLVGNAFALTSTLQAASGITTSAIPSAQIVASTDVQYQPDSEVLPSDGSQYGLSVAKMIHAKLILDEAELEGERYAAISSFQLADLLRRTPATSRYYNDVVALNKGELSHFLGFNIVRMQAKRWISAGAYTVGHDGTTPIYQCPFWIRDALVYRGRPITEAQIFRRPDKSMTPQAFYKIEDGAVRRYDTAVVRVDCYAGAAY